MLIHPMPKSHDGVGQYQMVEGHMLSHHSGQSTI
jgi:hypothetical protein